MILTSVIRDLLRQRRAGTSAAADRRPAAAPTTPGSGPAAVRPKPVRYSGPGPAVLNVGGNNKQIPIPDHYRGWAHLLLDIDPAGNPDIVCDARELTTLEPAQFDAIYCSHNLEHYFKHDGARVLAGFLHVLKATGFAEIRVPDLKSVMAHVVATGMDIEDTLYVSPMGPIAVRDVVYGLGRQIERSGNDFFAHKCGFTARSLRAALELAGFRTVHVMESPEIFEVRALAFKGAPSDDQRALLRL